MRELDEITDDELLPDDLDLELDDLARDDALKVLEPSEDGRDFDLDPDAWIETEQAEPEARLRTADSTEHVRLGDEPYDAVDAEDVGTAWLRRATQSAEPREESDPNDIWGTQLIEPPELDGSRREAAYGRDREGTPLARHAGTHAEDVAAELPVGTLDESGNAELHAPVNPPDAFDAPPTGSLSPTEEEIARRAAAETERLRSRR